MCKAIIDEVFGEIKILSVEKNLDKDKILNKGFGLKGSIRPKMKRKKTM